MSGKPAARQFDLNSTNRIPAVEGSPTVLINNRPAVRQGDKYADGDMLGQGSPTVWFENKLAGRVTDRLASGLTHVIGSPNVFIGTPSPPPTRKPFSEICEYAPKPSGGGS